MASTKPGVVDPMLGNLTSIKANKSIIFDSRLSGTRRSDLRLIGNDDSYNVSQNAVDSISYFFQDSFTTKMGNQSTSFNSTFDSNTASWSGTVPGRLNGFYMTDWEEQYDPSVSQVYWAAADIPALFAAMARSMSNAIRDGADAETGQTVLGATDVLVVLYQVQWGWIAVHLTVFTVGVVFLVSTIYQSRPALSFATIPSWKSSALAPLDFGAQLGHVFGACDSVEAMEKTAEKQLAKLRLKPNIAPGNESNDSLETMIPI